MKIYIAAPFFTEAERAPLDRAEQILRARGFDVFSPREHDVVGMEVKTPAWASATFQVDLEGLMRCDCVVSLYHGAYGDTGTAWECGYACAAGKPVIVVQLGNDSNLMVHEGCRSNITLEQLETYDFETMPAYGYEGEMM